MEAEVWTLIGLLGATAIGTLLQLNSRLDGLEGRFDGLNGRIDGLTEVLRAQGRELGELNGRIDGVSGRIDRVSGRIDGLTEVVRAQGRELGEQIYGVAQRLEEHLRRHAS